jgi:hypothetical protein
MTSSSKRKGLVRMGGAIYDTLDMVTRREPIIYVVTLGIRTEQNLYVAEFTAIAKAVRCLSLYLVSRQITIFTSNIGALLAVSQQTHQSKQLSKGSSTESHCRRSVITAAISPSQVHSHKQRQNLKGNENATR